MDRNYIDSHHVVARYLADQLSEEELRAFEECMVIDSAIVKELEIAARLKVGLHTLSETGELTTLLKRKPVFQDSRILALAASIAIVAVCVFLWFGRGTLQAPKLAASLSSLADRSGKPLIVANTYAILRTRGVSYDAEIELPAAPEAIELRVLPEIEAHPARYRVAIARIADDDSFTSIGTVSGLAPDKDGFTVLYFDSSKLRRGRYQLTIGGDVDTDAAESTSSFLLKLSPSRSEQTTR